MLGNQGIDTRRKVTNYVMLSLTGLATALVIGVLLLVIGYTLVNGISFINIGFIIHKAAPVSEAAQGGMRNEIIGTGILIALASVIGLPTGLLAGVFLSEFGNNRLGWVVRIIADVFTGVPSIVVGVFAYVVLVVPLHSFSALAGGVALAIIMLPVVARTAEEMMRFVPVSHREAALALGIPRWRMILSVVIPGAMVGIVTGAMLAIARIAGETAPLLFTALGNNFGFQGLFHPIAALPLLIFNYAMSPYKIWHQQAWAASFLLVMLVLLINILVRWVTARRYQR